MPDDEANRSKYHRRVRVNHRMRGQHMFSTRSWTLPCAVVTLLVASCGSGGTTRVSAGADETPSSTRVDDDDSTTSSTTRVPDTSSTSTSSSTTSTTTIAPTSTTTAVSAPTTLEFNGRHEGTEHFGLDTARCPFLDHHLDEEFTLTDGTPWHFTSVYCGTIDAAGVWSGTGNFTLTSPAGDTLSGHSTSRAQLPTTGVPYRLDIDGGTGQFTGTSGMCSVGEHLSSDGFGIQAHSGAFTCSLTIPANPGR